jgi:UDP-N-acetylglucosamine 3-dehydrogenase
MGKVIRRDQFMQVKASPNVIRVAVLGVGMMGRQHLRILSSLERVVLVAACDHAQQPERVHSLQIPLTSDWRDVLALRPDAIVNALPTGCHFEVTKAFLEAGIHVLVEKPIATTVPEAAHLEELAERNDVVLMVGHVERFNPAVQALRELVTAGRLGEIISAAARRVGVARPTLPHANVVLDLAIHDIDTLEYVLGHDGRLLMAATASLGPNHLEDHVDLVLVYGQTIACIQANWITPVKIRRLSFTGSKGFAELDYIDQSVRMYASVPRVIKGTPWDFFAVSKESDAIEVPVRRQEPLRLELEHFMSCVEKREVPRTNARSARRALALAIEATQYATAAVQSEHRP